MSTFPLPVVEQAYEVTANPVVSLVAYTANDALGGKLSFLGATANVGQSIRIRQIVIIDKADQKAQIDLVLFGDDFTPTADADPFDPTDADLLKVAGLVKVAAADYVSFADSAMAIKGIDVWCRLVGSALHGQLVVRGTPTYVATSDIVVKLIYTKS